MALIPPVSSGIPPLSSTKLTTPADRTSASGAAERGADFSNSVGRALDDLQSQQTRTDQLARDAATGKLQNIEEYLMSATETQLATQLTVAVRNRAVEAFNEIMRMQV